MTKATRETSLTLGLKAQISILESAEKKHKKQLEKLTTLHQQSRTKLGDAYRSLMALIKEVPKIKSPGSQKAKSLIKRIEKSEAQNLRLTEVRDSYATQIETLRESLSNLSLELMVLKERERNNIDGTNEIVTQVFALNEAMVQASTARDDCLRRHVFPHLLDEKGNMRSQISFQSSDGLKKVVAMVNTMTIMRSDLTDEATREIEKFFERFKKPVQSEPHLEAMMQITRELLVEKTSVKPGPSLYRFIAMELDAEIFPELARAQLLLKQSIRSEKTNSYIRLYQRANRNENFEVVPQS